MRHNVYYGKTEDAWKGYEALLKNIIEEYSFKKICDIGGGANPVLSLDYILEKKLDYFVLDISKKELDKSPKQFKIIVQDITAEVLICSEKFDFIFTKMLAEHVKSGFDMHRNIYSLLNKGGIAVHFFPTLYALPFLINRLLPESIAKILLNFFAPRDRYQHDMFPAYYSWCRGPTNRMIKKFEELGFEIMEYKGFFGHSGYYDKIPIVRNLHRQISKYLLKHPSPYFTSYSHIILKNN